MASRKTTDPEPDESTVDEDTYLEELNEDSGQDETATNGGYVPKRSATATQIPPKSRATSLSINWEPEIDALGTEALGQAFSYEDVPNVSGECQRLRRDYGVNAVSRDVITKKNATEAQTTANKIGHGTLWLEVPSKDDGHGNLIVDTDTMNQIKAKYAV